MTLEPGSTLGRYQILEPLGQGGMATVYRAFQPALERVVALKVIRPGFAEDPEFLERFRREARAIAKLEHPNIVQVFDFDQDSGRYFMAMQHLEGGTLKARLAALAQEGRRLAPAEVARIISEVAAGLRYAHAEGVLHRDMKPSNILFTRDGRAVVSDFGIAKILGGTQLTQTGVGIGTPEYMSPEQGQGLAIDQRSDIYALGTVAYELLTGRVPYLADTPFAVVLAHLRDPLPLPTSLNPALPRQAEQVLLRALAKDPAQRYAAATEFAAALDVALAAAERPTAPTVRVRRAEERAAAAPTLRLVLPLPALARPTLLAGAAVLFVALLGGGAAVLGMFGAGPPAPTPTPASTRSPAPAGAVAPAPATPVAKRGGELRVLLPSEPREIDPAAPAGAGASAIAHVLFDTLVESTPEYRIDPALAESWTISADGRTYTFKLRSGVRFAIGRVLGAADVKYSIERVRDSPASLAYKAVTAIETPDASTVVLRLSEPFAPLLGSLGAVGIVAREMVEAKAAHSAGTGAFTFAEWARGQHVKLEANRAYWRAGIPRLDRLIFTFNPDAKARAAAIQAGSVDLVAMPDLIAIDALRKDAALVVHGGEGSLSWQGLFLNTQQVPFSDLRTRQAIYAALDRDAIAKAALPGTSSALHAAFLPRTHWAGLGESVWKQDLSRARMLLAEAGQPSGFSFTVLTPPDYRTRTAEAITAQLRPLGIEVKTVTIPLAALLQALDQGNLQAALLGFSGSGDPEAAFQPFLSGGITKFRDARLEELVSKARATTDPTERARLYREAQVRIAETGPVAFLHTVHSFDVARKDVTGYTWHPSLNYRSLREVWLDR